MGLEGATQSTLRPSGGDARKTAAAAAVASGIAVGDRVVRGPSWNWGARQDGGPGNLGTVIDVRKEALNCTIISYYTAILLH